MKNERCYNGRWRGIVHGAGDAAWNMAVDEAIFEAVVANSTGPTLRLYQWERPSVSLGRFQSVDRTLNNLSDRLLRCKDNRLGILTQAAVTELLAGQETHAWSEDRKEGHRSVPSVPVVRRITGGRGILHGRDLTLSFAAAAEAVGLSRSVGVSAIHERLAQGYLTAFEEMGIRAMRGASQILDRRHESPGDCFATVSQADIVHMDSGRKLLGGALHIREGYFLQQVSIPYDALAFPYLRAEIFRGSVPDNVQGIDFQYDIPDANVRFTPADMVMTLLGSFEDLYKVEIDATSLTEQEALMARQRARERYTNPEWTWSR